MFYGEKVKVKLLFPANKRLPFGSRKGKEKQQSSDLHNYDHAERCSIFQTADGNDADAVVSTVGKLAARYNDE